MDPSDEIRMRELQNKIDDLSKQFADYKNSEQEKESRRLRTALIAAGSIIIALGGFVWAEIVWPVIKLGMSK